jgi:hypothetical protein
LNFSPATLSRPARRLRRRNAPIVYDYVDGDAFANDNNATVCYLPWTTRWGETYGGRPTAIWNPVEWLIELADGSAVAKPKPLTATLWAAQASIDRGNFVSAANQLRAFQNTGQAQVADPALARQFIEAAQHVIDALQVSP